MGAMMRINRKKGHLVFAPILPVGLLLLLLVSCVDTAPVDGDWKIGSHVTDWREEVIYQVMIDRFANGDLSNDVNVDSSNPGGWHGGDWQGLIDKLDYIEQLGVTALWISPVVKNVDEDAGFSAYHGYWTQDFVSTNPHFGDLAKLRELSNACHERGIKIILDVVVNHVGQLFYYDINKNGQPDEWLEGSGSSSDLKRVTEWDPDYNEDGIQSFTSLGPSGLAPVRFVNMPSISRTPPIPEVFQNPDWYNRKGRVTVWGREMEACIAAGKVSVPDDVCDAKLAANKPCEEQEEFIATKGGEWRSYEACWSYVRQQETLGDFPGGLKDIKTTLPEVRQALIDVFAYWIEAADLDGFRIDTLKHVEHEFFEQFCPAMRQRAKQLGKDNFYMFGEVFDGYDPLLGSYTYNDSVDGVFYFSQKYVIDSVFKYGGATSQFQWLYDERVSNYSDQPHTDGPLGYDNTPLVPQQLLVSFLDNHDLSRYLYEYDDPDGLRLALFYILTTDGIPCIYYGTEQDFNGGNDPANREDMWTTGYATDGTTFKHIQKLIALRKAHKPLMYGELDIRWTTDHTGDEIDAGIYAFERVMTSGERALVVINTSQTKASSTTDGNGNDMSTGFAAGTTLTDVFNSSGEQVTVGAGGSVSIVLPAFSGKIFIAR